MNFFLKLALAPFVAFGLFVCAVFLVLDVLLEDMLWTLQEGFREAWACWLKFWQC